MPKRKNEKIGGGTCPFNVGDLVRFTPDAHAYGWLVNEDFFGLKPNQVGAIERIEGDGIYLAGSRAALHWQCFSVVEPTT